MATNPTLLAMPLAENGTKNVIPETQATAGDGLFSQSTGFPTETSLPLGAGGVAPSREDFNGMANLLGGVAFMAQKGFTFNYDATQDYYTGCVVIDSGNRYLCIADMPAGTVAPSADTTGTYWTIFPLGLINKSDVVTTSGTYTAPVTGWYKIVVKGGGGGGAGGSQTTTYVYNLSAPAGGEGGTTIAYEKMTAGQTVNVVIGGGGAGGAAGATTGTDGGDSSVVVNGHTYTGGGGKGAAGGGGGAGGTGTIVGEKGSAAIYVGASSVGNLAQVHATGTKGGGSGANQWFTPPYNDANANSGCGGGGGGVYSNVSYAGGSGASGFVEFEYFNAG